MRRGLARRSVAAEAEHRRRGQRWRGVEAEGAAGEQPDAGVDGLNERVGEPVLEGDEGGVDVVGDGVPAEVLP